SSPSGSSSRIAATASPALHASFASTRSRASGPIASRIARTVSSEPPSAKPTFRYTDEKPRSTPSRAEAAICSGRPAATYRAGGRTPRPRPSRTAPRRPSSGLPRSPSRHVPGGHEAPRDHRHADRRREDHARDRVHRRVDAEPELAPDQDRQRQLRPDREEG